MEDAIIAKEILDPPEGGEGGKRGRTALPRRLLGGALAVFIASWALYLACDRNLNIVLIGFYVMMLMLLTSFVAAIARRPGGT